MSVLHSPLYCLLIMMIQAVDIVQLSNEAANLLNWLTQRGSEAVLTDSNLYGNYTKKIVCYEEAILNIDGDDSCTRQFNILGMIR